MGSRSTRRKRELLAKAALQAVTPKAGTETPDQEESEPGQTANLGAGGRAERLDNGLTPIKDARLLARSFSWKREARFPTRVPTTEIVKAALAEGRGLTALETSIVNAAQLAAHGQTDRAREVGIRAILMAERANQMDDHAKLKRPAGVEPATAAGSSAIPPGGILAPGATIQNIGSQNAVIVDGGPANGGRSRFLELRDRFRDRGILPITAGSGSGGGPGSDDQPGGSAG